MIEKFKQAELEVKEHRDAIIEKLLQFSVTDSLFFWSDNPVLGSKQEKLWLPILKWANDEIRVKYTPTKTIEVPSQPKENRIIMKNFLQSLSDKELTGFYLAALNTNSEILAAALVKGYINAEDAFDAAYLEELWQAENWGYEAEAEKKRQSLKQELIDIEKMLKQ